MPRPVRLLPLALVLAAAGPPAATAAQQPGDAGRAFRGGVDLVVVDAVVRDGNGDVVRGLTADDFEVLEDGEPQTIVSFGFEQVLGAPLPAVAAPLLRAGPPPPDAAPAGAAPPRGTRRRRHPARPSRSAAGTWPGGGWWCCCST